MNFIGTHHQCMTCALIVVLVPGLLGSVGGCDAAPIAAPGTDDRVTLSSEIFDESEYGEYQIEATPIDDDARGWLLTLKPVQGPPNNSLTFIWDIDGHTYEGASQTVTFSEPGSYVVSVTGLDRKDTAVFTLQMTIEIPILNSPPHADAGPDKLVDELALVFLFGGGSTDSDNDELTYLWTQTTGPPIQLLNHTQPSASFVAPLVEEDTLVDFLLTVSDGHLTGQDTVSVYVVDLLDGASSGPVANAGPDQRVTEHTTVTLDGMGSSPSGEGTLLFEWFQIHGPSVTFSDSTAPVTTFQAPPVDGQITDLVFELVVAQDDIGAASDTVIVTVLPDASTTDNCPDDPNKTEAGECGCGIPDTDSDDDDVADCNDGCPADPNKVSAGTCGCGFVDKDCDDGVFCNGVEICVAGSCQPGSAIECDDGVPCTIDGCNETTDACENFPDDASCDNGLYCDGAETCDGGAGCKAGMPVDCNDGVACTNDSCNDVTESCEHVADSSLCDNGLFCDGEEVCDVIGDCQPGTPVDCSDDIACTVDSCNEASESCENNPDDGACDNGLYCDGMETCDALLGCQAGTLVDCDDGVACTVDSCNEASDSCENSPDDAACDNGLFCDGAEVCHSALGCRLGADPCPAQECDEDEDACVEIVCPDDDYCDDGVFCNGAETCVSNTCQPGIPVDCDDGVACTVDSCNEGTDSCDHSVNDANCNNGLFCDGGETCHATFDCQSGSNPCPGQVCDEAGDVCVDCLSDADCDDGVACTIDACNEATDSCENTSDDALCDNGLFCDGTETCDPASGCQLGSDPCAGDPCAEDADICVPPTIAVSTTSLDFGLTESVLEFEVWNSGGGTLDYVLVVDGGATWLAVAPNSGSSTGEHDTFAATVDRTGLSEGTHQAMITVTPSVGASLSVAVLMAVSSAGDTCVTSSPTWQNFAITPQTGTFTVYFDAKPNNADMAGLVGLSMGESTSYDRSAVTAAFSPNGQIEAWNDDVGWYGADTVVPYTPGTLYHFRLEINVPLRTYSVYVTPDLSTEQTIGTDYAFRSAAGAVTQLDHWHAQAGDGSHDVCDFTVGDCVVDSDGDGTADCQDGCPNDPNKTAGGACGCGVPDTDTDGDGVADCNDQCPGAPDVDSDGDGVADCVDACPGFDDTIDNDGDGTPDGCEPPELSAVPTSLNFGYTSTSSSFEVWNSGGGTLSYTISDNVAWLTVSPSGGDSTGEHDTIVATVDRTGLADDTYQGVIDVVPGTGAAISIIVTMNVGASTAVSMTTASRTTGVAPLAVFFDAVDTTNPLWTSGVVQADEVAGRREYAELHYKWDFADPSSGGWATNGKSKNEATGYVAAHVFETPGTYAIKLRVIHPNGQTYDYEQEIMVSDPALVFANSDDNSAERTFYVSTDGNDANNGSLNHPFKTWSKGIDLLFSSNGPRRLRFKRGTSEAERTYAASSSVTKSNLSGPFLIDAYGIGDNPIISSTHGGWTFGWEDGVSDVRIVDVDFATPNRATVQGLAPAPDSLILRSRISDYQLGIIVTNTVVQRAFIVDCDIVNSREYGVYYHEGYHAAVLGCEIDATDHAHLVRTYITKSLISHNRFGAVASGLHQLKFVGYSPDQNAGAVRYCVISDNLFDNPGGPGAWSVTIGPTDHLKDQRVDNCVFERNIMHAGPSTQTLLKLAARYVTVRNNIFVGTGSTLGVVAIDVSQRGIEPFPLGNHLYNNTGYRSNAGLWSGFQLCVINVAASNTTVKNNLASAPMCPEAKVVSDLGSGTILGINEIMDDPGWVQPGTDFHFRPDSDPSPASDLRPSAVDAGTTVPFVRYDFDGLSRPARTAFDLGACELP